MNSKSYETAGNPVKSYETEGSTKRYRMLQTRTEEYRNFFGKNHTVA